MENSSKGTVGVPSNAKQQRAILDHSKETGLGVRSDDTTSNEKRGEVFAPSVAKSILDDKPGFGKVKPDVYDAQGNRGLDQFKHDSRNSPLPEDGVKLDIHGRRRDEHAIGRSIHDVNDDNTVFGEDLGQDQERGKPENRDIANRNPGSGQGFQKKEKNKR